MQTQIHATPAQISPFLAARSEELDFWATVSEEDLEFWSTYKVTGLGKFYTDFEAE